jgi:hypothetical protein
MGNDLHSGTDMHVVVLMQPLCPLIVFKCSSSSQTAVKVFIWTRLVEMQVGALFYKAQIRARFRVVDHLPTKSARQCTDLTCWHNRYVSQEGLDLILFCPLYSFHVLCIFLFSELLNCRHGVCDLLQYWHIKLKFGLRLSCRAKVDLVNGLAGSCEGEGAWPPDRQTSTSQRCLLHGRGWSRRGLSVRAWWMVHFSRWFQ